MKQTYLLGAAEFYESTDKDFNKQKAEEQWQRLKAHIEGHDIVVKVVPGSPKLIESVYLTNAAIIVNDFAIMARYHKPSRQGEEKILAAFLKDMMGIRPIFLPDEPGLYFEGGGDARWSHQNQHVWFGYGANRSTLKGINAVIRILKEELGPNAPIVHKLRIDDKKTFHLDLAFLPLPNGRALYYPTLAAAAVKQIESVFGAKNTIKVPSKYFFACNSICINDKHILIPKLPYSEYRQWMYKATEMKLDEVNVNQFHLEDGSIQCLILPILNIPITDAI
jgi:N-dimethylarginine dimethylaminohydrolase